MLRYLISLAALICAITPGVVAAQEPIELTWPMLAPQKEMSDSDKLMSALEEFYNTDDPNGLGGVVAHGMLSPFDAANVEFVEDYDGKEVSLPGYIVPLDYSEEGTKSFLIVPFIGACLHVPPPPPNQLVFVESDTPYPVANYFEAIRVTGVFSRLTEQTVDLADVGYHIEAQKIEKLEISY